jgi:hypothetical protein
MHFTTTNICILAQKHCHFIPTLATLRLSYNDL